MKKSSSEKWIASHSKKESPRMVLLIIGNALFSVCGVMTALYAKYIIDAAQNADKNALIKNGVALGTLILLQTFLKVVCKALEARVQGKIEISIKTELFSSILKKDYEKITSIHTGELMTRLTSDVSVVSDGVVTILPSAVAMMTRLVCAFAALFSLDRMFSLILLSGGALLFVFTRFFRGKMKSLHKAVQKTDGGVRSFMQEVIENLLVVKIFDVADMMKDRSKVYQDENYYAKIKRNRWSIFANIGFSAAFSVGWLFAMLWSAARLSRGAITFGTLTAIVQLVSQVQTPVTSLSGYLPKYYTMLASADRILETESLPESVAYNLPGLDVGKLYDEMSYMEMESVTFGYGRENVIENGSVRINKGDFTVISGISGIGKSTFFKLLTGVLTPQKGSISVVSGGKKYHIDKYMRPLFAYVPQGNMLMSGTIRDNIKLTNSTATDEEVLEAAKISCAYDFINELPSGLDTVLMENGRGLSEGQIQRLAVARAVLSGAPVMLLDEATSALDAETEKKLLLGLRSLKDRTCVIISHKTAAFEVADSVIEIKDGHLHSKKI